MSGLHFFFSSHTSDNENPSSESERSPEGRHESTIALVFERLTDENALLTSTPAILTCHRHTVHKCGGRLAIRWSDERNENLAYLIPWLPGRERQPYKRPVLVAVLQNDVLYQIPLPAQELRGPCPRRFFPGYARTAKEDQAGQLSNQLHQIEEGTKVDILQVQLRAQ